LFVHDWSGATEFAFRSSIVSWELAPSGKDVTEVRQNDQIPGSTILQRLKAEEAYKELERRETRRRVAATVRTVWGERTFLFRISALGLILGLLVAFLIPARYTSTIRLMPPDNQSGSSLAMAAASMAASRGAGGLGEIAGDLLGLKNTSDVFVGILSSRTVQNQVIKQFDLKRVYGLRYMEHARLKLASRVAISVDRKNEMITILLLTTLPRVRQAWQKPMLIS
jgi:uncharacterized protein involved in exopolysaccharide biosynthesis